MGITKTEIRLLKIKFHVKVWRITIIRNLLGFIGLFAYPFINKDKARWNKNFWWLMLNDDELKPKNSPYDFDADWAEREGIDNPKWASYRFNALRNRAYNYLRSIYLKATALDVDNYKIIEGKPEAMEWKGGKVWFKPNESTREISLRSSYTGKILGIPVKWQYGDFGDRYDVKFRFK